MVIYKDWAENEWQKKIKSKMNAKNQNEKGVQTDSEL